MRWYVYLLIDPTDGEIRYVGGSKNPKARLYAHRWEYSNKPKVEWIHGLLKQGHEPVLEILVELDSEAEMAQAEVDWIRRLKLAGCVLFNHARRRYSDSSWMAARTEKWHKTMAENRDHNAKQRKRRKKLLKAMGLKKKVEYILA